jgi:hypothetical protein
MLSHHGNRGLTAPLVAAILVGLALAPPAAARFGVVGTIGSRGDGPGQLRSPIDVATDGAGNVYVLDSLLARVEKFSSAGSFLTQWGTAGSGDGQFTAPTGIAVDGAGSVYVADAGNNRIERFSSNGDFLGQWGGQDVFFTTDLLHVAADAAGNVYVVDPDQASVKHFSSDGTLLASWGGEGSGDGEFERPRGIAVDDAGTVYVGDDGRVQRFSPAGDFLGKSRVTSPVGGDSLRPLDLALAPGGLMYMLDGVTCKPLDGDGRQTGGDVPSVDRLTTGGRLLGRFSNFDARDAGGGGISCGQGLAADPSGNLYVGDRFGDRVVKFGEGARIGLFDPPVISRLRIRPRAFPAANSGLQYARRRGGAVSYRLTLQSDVRFAIERKRGRRYVRVRGGSFPQVGLAGRNRFRLTGRYFKGGRDRKLAPGSYRLVAVATGSTSGKRSVRRSVRFRIVR